MGLAYFEMGDMDQAREEFMQALRLDPSIMIGSDGSGITAHIVTSHNYAGLCLEMAKLYAREHDADRMLFWLAKGGDAGLNLRNAVYDNAELADYRKDPRLVLLIANEAGLHSRAMAAEKAPSLGKAH
jgi:tetratricopeptide (TPR) repeat protein